MQWQGQNKNSLNMIVPLTVCKQKAENQSSLMMNKNSAHKCDFCIFMRNNKKRNKNKEAAETFPTPACRQNVVSFLLFGDMPKVTRRL